ncbi:hypothetical protein [Ruegeria arenilitoris]|uniref:hypothetical protein n=1 Tax=Ruegeria arenilitoris TaxID=1173585 RepID=UPI00147B8307|nr:hypothetical protein [Ruegeria arenilitoris]
MIWEIDENLMRSELTPTQMAEHLAKRKELWAARAISRQVVSKPRGGRPSEFASETAEVAGVDTRTVQRAVSRAEGVTHEARDAIKGTEHDKGVVLYGMRARLP